MRNLYATELVASVTRRADDHVMQRFGSAGDETCGMFTVRSPTDGADITVIASSGEGWDHVSASRKTRCPNWVEMAHIKHLFFKDTETAMQLHVPSSDHINIHSFCLHLWRPLIGEIPRPPGWMVGPEPIRELKRESDSLMEAKLRSIAP